jgi:outer membrane immunogenic protein
MKAHLLGSMLAIASIGSAAAADLRPAPYQPPPVAPPVWTWTGFYIGIHAGAATGTMEWTQNLVNVPPFGGFFPGTTVTATSHSVNGYFGGAQVGFNYQTGWVVWGIEADASATNIKGKGGCGEIFVVPLVPAAPAGLQWQCNTRTDSLATVAGRVGAAVDRALFYVKGGAVWSRDKYDLAGNGVFPTVGPIATSLSDKRWGWMAGVGVEYALPGNWSAKVEYNYLNLGSRNYAFENPTDPANNPLYNNWDITQTLHVVKVGLNYRFGFGASRLAQY